MTCIPYHTTPYDAEKLTYLHSSLKEESVKGTINELSTSGDFIEKGFSLIIDPTPMKQLQSDLEDEAITLLNLFAPYTLTNRNR